MTNCNTIAVVFGIMNSWHCLHFLYQDEECLSFRWATYWYATSIQNADTMSASSLLLTTVVSNLNQLYHLN